MVRDRKHRNMYFFQNILSLYDNLITLLQQISGLCELTFRSYIIDNSPKNLFILVHRTFNQKKT
jgi:hypothetical protein